MEKTKTIVRIGGREYPVIAYEEPEYIHRVAVLVDRRMAELALATHISTNQLAVLTCVNIADELIKAQDENIRIRKELNQVRTELTTLRQKLQTAAQQRPKT